MIKLIRFAFILNILLSLVTGLSYAEGKISSEYQESSEESSFTSKGVKIAKIIVPRAVVYADENLNQPLGYIGNGKLITVGRLIHMTNFDIKSRLFKGT